VNAAHDPFDGVADELVDIARRARSFVMGRIVQASEALLEVLKLPIDAVKIGCFRRFRAGRHEIYRRVACSGR
jgi:hypothetical protein